MRKIIIFLITLSLPLMLISCNVDDSDDLREKVEINHLVTTKGVTNVEVSEEVVLNPEVVAVFDLSFIDIIDYIGFDKFNISNLSLAKGSLPNYLSHYNKSEYQNVGTLFDVDFEVLDFILPDLIVIGGRSAVHYDILKEKYPTSTVLDISNTTFMIERFDRTINNIGLVFPNVKNELDNAHDEIVNKINNIGNIVNTYDVSILMVTGDDYSVYGRGSRFTTIFDDFKFKVSDPNLQTQNAHGHIIDSEYFSNNNPSIIFFIDRGFATGEADPGVARAMENPYIVATKAGKNNHLYQLDANAWYILPGGITSTNQMINDINQFIDVINGWLLRLMFV